MHESGRIVSFCFDDGFRRSAESIRDVFEARGLAACFAVLAAPERCVDPYVRGAPIADWAFWREARSAGHEISPHGYAHERLKGMAFDLACDSVERTADVFDRELPGFALSRCLFHLPYLQADDDFVAWLGERTLGVRVAMGRAGRNAWEDIQIGGKVDAATFGPKEADLSFLNRLGRFLDCEDGWLVLVLHGLDGEGWGSVSRRALEELVDVALASGARVEPPDRVLLRSANLW